MKIRQKLKKKIDSFKTPLQRFLFETTYWSLYMYNHVPSGKLRVIILLVSIPKDYYKKQKQ